MDPLELGNDGYFTSLMQSDCNEDRFAMESQYFNPNAQVLGYLDIIRGRSYGCLGNSGAAGTFYDAVPCRLIVSNHNISTDTDTLLLEFPNQPLWTNVYIQNHAKATVPLLWSRVQVQGQLSLSCGATLSFGLVHYAFSEFELMAEELLMSESVIKNSGPHWGVLAWVKFDYSNAQLPQGKE